MPIEQSLNELARLRAAHGHLQQELAVMRSREMILDDIAAYVDERERWGKVIAEKDAEIERLRKELANEKRVTCRDRTHRHLWNY